MEGGAEGRDVETGLDVADPFQVGLRPWLLGRIGACPARSWPENKYSLCYRMLGWSNMGL